MRSMVTAVVIAGCLATLCAGCPGSKERAVRVAGSTSVAPFAEQLAQEYERKFAGRRVEVQAGGSAVGLSSVSSGLADVGMCSRELKEDEAKQLNAILIARDGLAVIVHPSNPVKGLSTEQIRKLFSGRVRNWNEVGGPDEKVWLITREDGSGTRESFMHLVLKSEPIAASALVQESNGTVKKLVAGNAGAIGYMSLGLEGTEVKGLEIDGVAPTKENVLKGDYKLARPFLFITKGTPAPAAQQFIDYVLSPEGQGMLDKEGLVQAK